MKKANAPLAGRRVAITRAAEQAGGLRETLQALGADVIELPLIRVSAEIDKQTLADCMLELGSYDWLVFTSANGVRFFFEQFFKLFDDIRSLGLMRIACIGSTTAKAVEALHLKVECLPKEATAERLAEALEETGSLDNARVLLITGNLNRDALLKKLETARAIVDSLQVYKTEQAELAGEPAAADFCEKGADAVLFASSSAVQSFAAQGEVLKLRAKARTPVFGSIGPQTSEALRLHGLPLGFEARQPGVEALVQALVETLAQG